MLPELQVFIKDNFSPEMVVIVERLFSVFEDLSVEDFQLSYLSVLMDEQVTEGDTVTDRFYKQLQKDANFILSQFEIKLSDEAELVNTTQILEALSLIESYDNKQDIVDVLESSDDTDEALAGIVELMSGMSRSLVYRTVDSVNPALIDVVKKLCVTSEEENQVQLEVNNKLIANLKDFRSYLGDHKAFAFELVKSGQPIGANFSHYFNIVRESFLQLENRPEQAKELVALMFLSGDAYENPIQFYNNNSDQIFENLSLVTKVDIEITRLLNHYLAEKESRTQGNKNA